jgi:tetratricopeptide (TPR) repeat protein
MTKKLLFCSISILLLSSSAFAQEFEIKKYEINARVVPEEQKVAAQTKLRLVNLSDPDMAERILLSPDNKPRLSFYLNSKAKVEAMKVNGAAVQPKTAEDSRNNLTKVYVEMTSAMTGLREFDVDLDYSIPAADRGAALHVSGEETYLLPASFWVPVTHTPYADHGADTAPFSLTVAAPAGLKVISSGVRKNENSFEQSLAALPFFIIGDYDVASRGGADCPVEVYYPRGSGEAGKQQAERIAAEAERAVKFYAKYFNAAPVEPFRVISTQARQLNTATSDSFSASRETSASMVGAVTIDENIFRRNAVDLGTIELLSGAAARAWIDGQVLLRGRGAGMLRDALPVYLVAQYLGDRFGLPQRDAAFERFRRAYAAVARNDAPLLMQSPLDRNYATSVYNKGALVWRMMEKTFGVLAFEKALRSSLSRGRVDALSLAGWLAPQQTQQGQKKSGASQPHPLCQFSRCANFKENLVSAGADRKLVNELFYNWIETVTLPDFAVGQPQNTANGVESTVANFGSFDDTQSKAPGGDFTVEVVATNDKGEKISKTVTVKAGEYGSVSFPAGVDIKTVEVDPDKICLQSDYSNDVFPRRPSQSEAFGQANLAFSKNDFATAEAKAREGLAATSNSSGAPTLQALLGRALLAQKKNEEAAKIFDDALKSEPLPIQAYGLANFGLAELAMQQNKFDAAAKHFRFAAAADLDAATTIAARDGALKAERGANAVKIPEDVRAFLQKFDGAVLQGSAAVVNPFVDLGNLRKFAQSLVVRKPSAWVTEALRAEEWDASRTAVDVTLKIKIEGKDYAGRAVYVISRAGGKLLLSEVPTFDVK